MKKTPMNVSHLIDSLNDKLSVAKNQLGLVAVNYADAIDQSRRDRELDIASAPNTLPLCQFQIAALQYTKVANEVYVSFLETNGEALETLNPEVYKQWGDGLISHKECILHILASAI